MVDKKVAGAITAIADREASGSCIQATAAEPALNGRGSFGSSKSVLERVRGDQDVHALSDEGVNMRESSI